jgi:hypothetical protein
VFLYHSAASGPIQGVKKAQLEILLVKGVIKDRRAAASHEIPPHVEFTSATDAD